MLLVAITIAAAITIPGCDVVSHAFRHRLSLRAPELPGAWPGGWFELSWIAPDGSLRHTPVEPGGYAEVDVPRGIGQFLRFEPVLAFPAGEGPGRGFRARPAAVRYPGDLEGRGWGTSMAQADWVTGYVASVERRIREAGGDGSPYAWDRLRGEILERMTDPWVLDPSQVAAWLTGGTFRADRLREPRRFEVALPGPGPWIPPSARATAPSRTGEGYSASLPEGVHRFEGPEGALLVTVSGSGLFRWARVDR